MLAVEAVAEYFATYEFDTYLLTYTSTVSDYITGGVSYSEELYYNSNYWYAHKTG